MKILFGILALLFHFTNVYSSGGEIWIKNISSEEIQVRIIPVSAIFNNDNLNSISYANYNLLKTSPNAPNDPQRRYITSINEFQNTWFSIPSGIEKYVDFDQVGGSPESTIGTIGFGIYKFEFWWDGHNPATHPADDYFTLEFDWGYTNSNRNFGCTSQPADILIHFTNEVSGHPRIQYLWRTCECAQETDFQDVPQDRKLYERIRGCTGQTWEQDLGNFKYNLGTELTINPYRVIPLDPRRDCDYNYPFWPMQNHYFFDDNCGKFTLNLTIEKNVTTSLVPWSVEFPSFPPITITNGATLKLTKGVNNQERTFTFKKYTDYNQGTDLYITTGSSFQLEASTDAGTRSHVYFQDYCDAEVDAEGWIDMGYNSIITLQNNSTMYWFPNSQISGEGNAKIEINTGAELHNCNAHIYAPLNIHQNGGQYIIHNPQTCYTANAPQEITQTVEDGSSIEIFDGGILTVEENCTLVFDGEDSYLKAGPGTIVQLGEGVTIEFINGAYLDADGCTFTSINSGEIWQGIVLDEAGSQTNIRNCTFNDAAASIEVSNSV